MKKNRRKKRVVPFVAARTSNGEAVTFCEVSKSEKPDTIFPDLLSAEVTEVGLIDGGDYVNVLGMRWREADKWQLIIRLRFSDTGNNIVLDLSEKQSMEEAIDTVTFVIRQAIGMLSGHRRRLLEAGLKRPTILTGEDATNWQRSLVSTVQAAHEELDTESERTVKRK